ncbi:RagB/SusD family nutrient uptake outer membrane protein [Niabella aurantiaca]|uniref:RagB/SusD family nutrient uptake outer membrane protein n=1 Tax=Niabella aurantiaca TaxID=379900 RepID=UPI00036C3627|nr:RagB/SusD family nutrient uptake outer membrane protein [Niabella aurantiaca]
MKNQLYFFMVIFTGSAVLLGMTGCAKFLDKKTSNAIVVPQTVADLQALLDNAGLMNQTKTPASGEAAADNYFLTADYYKTCSPIERAFYTWQRYDYTFENDWSKAYTPVYIANYCLELLKKQEQNATNAARWGNVYGSALFFRSYYFQQLLWVYAKAYDEAAASADLGIALRLSYDFNEPSRRASVAECYQQVVNDTREAAYYLPDHPEHAFRPSKAAAYALLARTFLSMRRYDSAYKYADRCLKIKNDLIDFNRDPDLGTFKTTYPFKKFNRETVFYTEMMIGGVYGLVLSTRSKVDTVLYDKYAEADLRKKAYFLKSGDYYRFRGSYSKASVPFTGLATDEMYLIRAECSARRGVEGLQGALTDLNTLLAKRYEKSGFIEVTASTADAALNMILEERRKELIWRGIRWSDIKRLNKEGRNIVLEKVVEGQHYRLEPNSSYYALPLPTDIIDITGMPQNE